MKFKGQTLPDDSDNNEETFETVSQGEWNDIVKKIDRVLNEWERAIEVSDEEKLKNWYSTIALISSHNAYHTGQIIFIRKLQGSWDSSKGVK